MPSLTAYSQPLGRRKAKHLLRRACFNFSPEKIDEFANLTPSQALWSLSAPSVRKLYEPIDPKGEDWEDCIGLVPQKIQVISQGREQKELVLPVGGGTTLLMRLL